MKKDVLIHVRGLQMMDPEEEQEPIEIVVPGQYYYRNGSHYLRYEEMMDDTAEPTVNYIKMSAQGVEVRKQGQVNVHMVFEQGKKNMTFYSTPFGTLQMGIAATGLIAVSHMFLIHIQRVICFHLKILFTLHKLQVCGGNSHLKCSIRCGIISHILLTLLKYHMDIYQTLFTYFQTFL